MNFRNLFIGAATAGVLIATAASAQATQQSASANASATIVTPASMASTQDLAFGTVAKPTNGSNTVTVTAAAGSSASPTIGGLGNAYIATAGQAHAAIFHLAGTANTAYAFGTPSLTFGATADASLSPTVVLPATGNLNASGTADVPVGGTITIGSSTAATTYTGTLTLIANFQ
ncbi:MAG: hypothetical protein JWQ97_2990 [Phenylobacterium sp.]|nr:hypothetical protein [Phenylobacterium sp.]